MFPVDKKNSLHSFIFANFKEIHFHILLQAPESDEHTPFKAVEMDSEVNASNQLIRQTGGSQEIPTEQDISLHPTASPDEQTYDVPERIQEASCSKDVDMRHENLDDQAKSSTESLQQDHNDTFVESDPISCTRRETVKEKEDNISHHEKAGDHGLSSTNSSSHQNEAFSRTAPISWNRAQITEETGDTSQHENANDQALHSTDVLQHQNGADPISSAREMTSKYTVDDLFRQSCWSSSPKSVDILKDVIDHKEKSKMAKSTLFLDADERCSSLPRDKTNLGDDPQTNPMEGDVTCFTSEIDDSGKSGTHSNMLDKSKMSQKLEPIEIAEYTLEGATLKTVWKDLALLNTYKHGKFNRKVKCSICFYLTDTKVFLQRHLNGHLRPLEKGFKCPVCLYTAATKRCVQNHLSKCHQQQMSSTSLEETPDRLHTRGEQPEVANTSQAAMTHTVAVNGKEDTSREHTPEKVVQQNDVSSTSAYNREEFVMQNEHGSHQLLIPYHANDSPSPQNTVAQSIVNDDLKEESVNQVKCLDFQDAAKDDNSPAEIIIKHACDVSIKHPVRKSNVNCKEPVDPDNAVKSSEEAELLHVKQYSKDGSSNGEFIQSETQEHQSQSKENWDQNLTDEEHGGEQVSNVPCSDPDSAEKVADEVEQLYDKQNKARPRKAKMRKNNSIPLEPIEVTDYKLEEHQIFEVEEMLAKLDKVTSSGWDRKVRCAICLYSTDFKANLQRHIETHLQPLTTGFRCPLCLYTSKGEQYVRHHLDKFHRRVKVGKSLPDGSKQDRLLGEFIQDESHEHQSQSKENRDQSLADEIHGGEQVSNVLCSHPDSALMVADEAEPVHDKQNKARPWKVKVRENNSTPTEPIEVTDYKLEEHHILEIEEMLAKLEKVTSSGWKWKVRCAICLYSSDFKAHLQRHIENHLQPLTKGFRCPLCLYTSKGEQYVRHHLDKFHRRVKVGKSLPDGSKQDRLLEEFIQDESHEHQSQSKENRDQSLADEIHGGEQVSNVLCSHPESAWMVADEAEPVHDKQNKAQPWKVKMRENNSTPTEPIEVTDYKLEEHHILEVEEMLAKLDKVTSSGWKWKVRCAICLYSSDFKAHLQRHIENHLQPLTTGFRCPLCLYTSKGKQYVRHHLDKYHQQVGAETGLSNGSKQDRLFEEFIQGESNEHQSESKENRDQGLTNERDGGEQVSTAPCSDPDTAGKVADEVEQVHDKQNKAGPRKVKMRERNSTPTEPIEVTDYKLEKHHISQLQEMLAKLDKVTSKGWDRKVRCAICLFSAHFKLSLRRHVESHLQPLIKGFRCPLCLYTSKGEQFIRHHLNKFHRQVKVGKRLPDGSKHDGLFEEFIQSETQEHQSQSKENRDQRLTTERDGSEHVSNVPCSDPDSAEKVADEVEQVHDKQNKTRPRKVKMRENNSIPTEPIEVTDYKLEEHHILGVEEMLAKLDKVTSSGWDRKVRCAICLYSSDFKAHLQRHIKNHLQPLTTGFRCPLCPYTSKGEQFIRNHLDKYHLQAKVGKGLSNGSKQDGLFKEFIQIETQEHQSHSKENRDQRLTDERDGGEQVSNVPCSDPDSAEKVADEVEQVYDKQSEVGTQNEKMRENNSTPTEPIEVIDYKLEKHHISEVQEMLARLDKVTSAGWDRKVRCAICLYSADFKSSLRRHVESHLQPLTKGFKCPLCLYTSKIERGVRDHLEKYHQPRSPSDLLPPDQYPLHRPTDLQDLVGNNEENQDVDFVLHPNSLNDDLLNEYVGRQEKAKNKVTFSR